MLLRICSAIFPHVWKTYEEEKKINPQSIIDMQLPIYRVAV